MAGIVVLPVLKLTVELVTVLVFVPVPSVSVPAIPTVPELAQVVVPLVALIVKLV